MGPRLQGATTRKVREKLALKAAQAGDRRGRPDDRALPQRAAAGSDDLPPEHLPAMHDLGREESTYFITMEYVPGEDLKSLIHRIGALPIGKAVSIARQVCEGARGGPSRRRRPPRHEAPEHHDRPGGERPDHGFRHRPIGQGKRDHRRQRPHRHARVHVARAGGRQEAGPRRSLYSLGIVSSSRMLTGRLPFEGRDPAERRGQAERAKRPPDPFGRSTGRSPRIWPGIVLQCLDKAPERKGRPARRLSPPGWRRSKSVLPTTTTPLPLRRPATSKSITVRMPSKRDLDPGGPRARLAVVALALWLFLPAPASAGRSIAVMAFKEPRPATRPSIHLQETIPNLLITVSSSRAASGSPPGRS